MKLWHPMITNPQFGDGPHVGDSYVQDDPPLPRASQSGYTYHPINSGKQPLYIQDYTQEIPKTPEQVAMDEYVESLRTGAPIPYELLLRVQEITEKREGTV